LPILSRFSGIDLTHEPVPDATTLLNFRHLLEEHKQAPVMLGRINALLEAKGLLIREGTIVDATLIAAPPSTKNKSGESDPEIHQTKKGNQWYFGMKVQSAWMRNRDGVHTVAGTSAQISDVAMTSELLHGQENVVLGDAGYIGVEKREENAGKSLEWMIAMKRGKLKALPEGAWKETVRQIEKKESADSRAYGASLPCDQEPVSLSQNALSGTGKEHTSAKDFVRAFEFVP
jgi:transposase, IS5 family